MIKKLGFVALVGGALLQFGGCGWNLFGEKTFLYTSILNELLFS